MGDKIKKFSLIDSLKKADAELTGSPSLLGITALTYPNYVSSMRANMFTSHIKQCMTLLHPDVPYLFTNNENTIGKYSSGYKEAKYDYEVYKKVYKFDDITDNPFVYEMFVYNKDKKYSMILSKSGDNLLYADKAFDITNEVIAGLNKAYTSSPNLSKDAKK